MTLRAPGGRTSILIDPDSWLAGVMDAGGTFDLWRSGKDGRWCWRVGVRLNNDQAAAKFALLSSVKLRRIGVNRYVIPSKDALPLLNKVMPRMFCLHEEAGVVYRFLLTRVGARRGMRGALTTAVDRYRDRMVTRLREKREMTNEQRIGE